MRRLLGTVAVMALVTQSAAVTAAECTNDVWNKVMESGKIAIGVKADYKPWGYRDESGELVGMEIDMANEVAAAMGVEAELVPVQSSNRMQFLEQGKIDMLIATMSDRADRREIVGIPGPNYYTSGTNVMSPKALGFKEWEDLQRQACLRQAGRFLQPDRRRALRRRDRRLYRQCGGQAGAARQEMRRLGL